MRCVHLDFHTSPDIAGIGEKFDKDNFINTVKNADVELMTVFAKCHHGYTYYPTKVGTMHPGLKFNLLGEQLDALRSVGIKAPIYIPIGWSKKDADEHPEWRQIDIDTGREKCIGTDPEQLSDPEAYIRDCSWTVLCPGGTYGDYLEALTREICESFDVSDGIFYDICFFGDNCVCDACVREMKKKGLPAEVIEGMDFLAVQ